MSSINNYYPLYCSYFLNNVRYFFNKWKTISLIASTVLCAFTARWLLHRHLKKRKIAKINNLLTAGIDLYNKHSWGSYNKQKLGEAKQKFDEILKSDPSHAGALAVIDLIDSQMSYQKTIKFSSLKSDINIIKTYFSLSKIALEEVWGKMQTEPSDALKKLQKAEKNWIYGNTITARMQNKLQYLEHELTAIQKSYLKSCCFEQTIYNLKACFLLIQNELDEVKRPKYPERFTTFSLQHIEKISIYAESLLNDLQDNLTLLEKI